MQVGVVMLQLQVVLRGWGLRCFPPRKTRVAMAGWRGTDTETRRDGLSCLVWPVYLGPLFLPFKCLLWDVGDVVGRLLSHGPLYVTTLGSSRSFGLD